MKMRTTIKLLIDADVLCYKVANAVEREHRWDNGIWSYTADEMEAFDTADALLCDWAEELDADEDDVILCFSSPTNFRKTLYPDYKANRKGTRKPLVFSILRDYLAANYESREKPDLEADDVMGILATKISGDTIIVTIDKDLKQIPGKLWNPDKPDELLEITQHTADWHFYMQTLMGDRVDNYPGCPGMGEVRAARLLELEDEPWAAIVAAYEKAKLTEEDAITQARLARILRAEDYDFEKQEVILWTPN
jgi:DNA polymerase-1